MEKWSLKNLFRKATEAPVPPATILPRSIMIEIVSTPEHVIGKENIMRLVKDGESRPTVFANAALYTLLKAYSGDPDTKMDIIKRSVKVLSETPLDDDEAARSALRDIVEEFAVDLPESTRIPAGKLKRMNLMGYERWDQRYHDLALKCATDPREVFIVANSMFVGLSPFVRAFRDANKSLYVIDPSMLTTDKGKSHKKDNLPCGFVIKPNGTVSQLPRDFARPKGAVVIDDIRDKGKTEEKIKIFWTRNGDEAPTFDPVETLRASA